MKNIFPGYFHPTNEEFDSILGKCIFAFDANVLLNIYRYSDATRGKLEQALTAFKGRIFLPHQAAKEFLRNRHGVTALQAKAYANATLDFNKISDALTNTIRHPYLEGEVLDQFLLLKPKIVAQLENKKSEISQRITDDPHLKIIQDLFSDCTGEPFDDNHAAEIRNEGERRNKSQTPPGWKDKDKEPDGDINKKFGDLFIWKQVIARAQSCKLPMILVTDDKKEDWWLEQSGQRIGPQPELVNEFRALSNQPFWMYTVDQFLEKTSHITHIDVTADNISEVRSIASEKPVTTLFPPDVPRTENWGVSPGRMAILKEIAFTIGPKNVLNWKFEEVAEEFSKLAPSIDPGALIGLRGINSISRDSELTTGGWGLLINAAQELLIHGDGDSQRDPNLWWQATRSR